MYYISKMRFNMEVSKTNKLMFDGFKLLNRIKNPKNKTKEHFCQLPLFNDMIGKCEGEKDNGDELICSDTFKSAGYERKGNIADALAISLGFESHYQYKRKIKFLFDRKKLTKLEDLDYEYINNFDKSFSDNLNKIFSFDESPLIHTKIVTNIKNKKISDFMKGFYESEEEFNKLYEFVIEKNIFNNNEVDFNEVKSFLYMCNEPDIYESVNFLDYFIENEDNQEFSFMKKVNYLNDIFKVEDEINKLSDETYLKFITNISKYLRADCVRALKLLKLNKDDPYLLFLKSLN